MFLIAIRRFFWKGNEYQVDQVFEADEIKGPALIAESLAIEAPTDPLNESAAIDESTLDVPESRAADTDKPITSKPKFKKKKR